MATVTTMAPHISPPMDAPVRRRPLAPNPDPGPASSFLADLTRRFPGTSVWWGPYTGSWWARHPYLGRLVEATSPTELAALLYTAMPNAARARGAIDARRHCSAASR